MARIVRRREDLPHRVGIATKQFIANLKIINSTENDK